MRPARLNALKRQWDREADVTHLQKQQRGEDEPRRRVPHRSGVRRSSSSASGRREETAAALPCSPTAPQPASEHQPSDGDEVALP